MRRLRTLLLDTLEFVKDFLHAARSQVAAIRLQFGGVTGFTLGKADCAPIPVVMLPGILERSTYMAPLGRFLASKGHPIHVIDALGWNLLSIQDSVERCVKALQDQHISDAVLLAHSKGGLIGKAVLLDPRATAAVAGMVALSTPFDGSSFGGPLQYLPFAKRSPLGLFFPNNEALGRLSVEAEINSRIVSMAPARDQMIPGGSHLEGATNVTLDGRGHFRPVDDEGVWEQVHSWVHTLGQMPDRDP